VSSNYTCKEGLAVIIATLTLNIVQYVTVRLEQPLATNNFLWVELHRLYTPWIQEAAKTNYSQTRLTPSAPVNFLMELCIQFHSKALAVAQHH